MLLDDLHLMEHRGGVRMGFQLVGEADVRELLLEERAERRVAHELAVAALVVLLVLLVEFRQRKVQHHRLAGVLLVGVEVAAQEVIDALVQVQRERVVRNFVRVAVLDGDDAVLHHMLADLLQLVDGRVLQVEKGEQANLLPHVRVGRSLPLALCAALAGVHQDSPHDAHQVKVLLVLRQLRDVQPMLVNHLRVQTAKAAQVALAAAVQLSLNLIRCRFQRRL